jgi:hypothetical protein
MEDLLSIVRILADNLTKGMLASILTVLVICRIFRKVSLKQSLAPLRWFILFYAIMAILSIVYSYITVKFNFDRATGPYWWSYWLMFTCTCVLPFLLLHKKFKHNIAFMLILSIIINLGWLFELYVILVTSLHRDYLPSSWPDGNYIWGTLYIFGVLALQGILVGLLSILIGYLVNRLTKNNIFAKSLKHTTQNESAFGQDK